jgi:hypothetical protein
LSLKNPLQKLKDSTAFCEVETERSLGVEEAEALHSISTPTAAVLGTLSFPLSEPILCHVA